MKEIFIRIHEDENEAFLDEKGRRLFNYHIFCLFSGNNGYNGVVDRLPGKGLDILSDGILRSYGYYDLPLMGGGMLISQNMLQDGITILQQTVFCNEQDMRIILSPVKVLLIQPPIEDFYNTSIRTYPLGLLYLAAAIQDVADVAILDLKTGRKPKPLGANPFPDLETFYREGIRTPFSLFSTYYRFGADEGEIKREIERARPDVACISSIFTTYSGEAIDIARLVKEINSETVTVVGGIHPTLFPHHVLASPWVDYVVRGEGETPLLRLIGALKAGRKDNAVSIEGLCCRNGRGLHVSEPYVEKNIDLLPARNLIDPGMYRIGRQNYSFFLTSRGCPFHCAFCGRPTLPFRKRRIESMEKEIHSCLELNIGAIDFEDDMLTLDSRFFGEVLGLFKGKNFTLSAMNGIYTENLTTHTLEKMFEAGFRRLNFSLVDISRPLMKEQKRLFPVNFIELMPYLEDSPFLMETHFIIGLPGQTPDEIIDTILFLMGRRCLPGPSLFYLAPNSPVFDDNATGFDKDAYKTMRSSAMFPINPLLPRSTLYTFMKLVRFINYVKHVLDREPGLEKLSDLAALPVPAGNPIDGEIVSALVTDKKFKYYDVREKAFYDEPVDRSLVNHFFKRARGRTIRGFKASGSAVID
jgi:anaerobic magnesium-protoporphyrin IX monomethyl ester cyclase